MIKLQNNTLTREPLPVFLLGLQDESLRDLSWTDPALGVSDCAWLPEVDQSPALKQYERYGAETLTLGDDVAIVTRAVVPWSAAEISEAQATQTEALQDSIITATQARLDSFARTRNYDGILSACTYATSGVPKFAGEGQAAVDARDATWATLYTILGEVQAGTRPVPTGFADIEADLPVLVWPA